MTNQMMGLIADSAIRILYCASKTDFDTIFGEGDGAYLWHKFKEVYGGSEGSFICYLDECNREKLGRAIAKYISALKYGPTVTLTKEEA